MGRPKKEIKEVPVLIIEKGKKYTNGQGTIRLVTDIVGEKVDITVIDAPHSYGRLCKGASGMISIKSMQKFAVAVV